ncbi:BTB/POZ domain-containing protein At5g66560-like [Andrographis paniculata]|uniref:BTB/POZ domain-containing protein At5g66560-like n=1 Tax=Andrographis paniculata TaxID=175694 RepID=UPI0021E9A181|nr:BTB/POZ domain-containing protein At5g66560-like [Andrographis paniculata]
MAAQKKRTSKARAWFCTIGMTSDVAIEVEDVTFHLHKLPLISRSTKIHEMITEKERSARIRTDLNLSSQQIDDGEEEEEIREEEDDDVEQGDEEQCRIVLPDFPGGSESFETAAKFCYGVSIKLTASNVAALRCAGEYLKMTEEYSEDNLISATERFISRSVLKSIKHSIETLSSCKALLPMAEDLEIVQRCIEAVAGNFAASDPSLFGWPVSDGSEANHRRRFKTSTAAVDPWLDELTSLSLPFFKRLIFAMKGSDPSGEIIESCLIHYGKKFIPGTSRSFRKPIAAVLSEEEQRELLQTIVANLPKGKSFRSPAHATSFLFGLLRTAYILNAPASCRLTLELKIGSQLEQAALDDLLIPSYLNLNETLYDVNCVERMLRYFLRGMEERSAGEIEGGDENPAAGSAALTVVGKLIDGYLAEIASDSNLKPEKFYDLAVALPEDARLFDDGLYRAVDFYLKAHPWIPAAEREKICGVLNSRKLTLAACTHAAQNDRLPVRALVQVLYFEQVQLRRAIAGSLTAAPADAGEAEGDGAWRVNEGLLEDMESMRTRVHELEKECDYMKTAIRKMDPQGHVAKAGWWASIGCKIGSHVCDSLEPAPNSRGKKGN